MRELDPKAQVLSELSDDQVDLRRYASLIAAHWLWLAIPAILGLAGAVIAGFVLPPTYEAVALVAVDQSGVPPEADALIQFAMSDGVLQGTLDQLPQATAAAYASLADFRSDLRSHYTRPFVVLTTRAEDPFEAASTANEWASTLRDRLTAELPPQAGSEPASDPVAAQAMDAWREAELAWLGSEAQLKQAQLLSERQAQLNRRAELHSNDLRLETLAQQLTILAQQLMSESPDVSASPEAVIEVQAMAEEFGRLDARTAVAGASPEEGGLLGSLGAGSVQGDLVDAVEYLLAVAASKREMIQAELSELEARLAAARAELVEVETQLSELSLRRDVARETVQAIERARLQQALASQERTPLAEVASMALPPSVPRSPRPVRDGFLAGIAGALLGLGGLLLRDWRSSGPRPPLAPPSQTAS